VDSRIITTQGCLEIPFNTATVGKNLEMIRTFKKIIFKYSGF